jgi:hypothetical protein
MSGMGCPFGRHKPFGADLVELEVAKIVSSYRTKGFGTVLLHEFVPERKLKRRMTPMRRRLRLPEITAISFLVLLVFFFFRKILYPLKPLYGSDFILQFYPWKKFAFDYFWSHGSIPFWNPYTLSGTPFIANIQASMFYPMGFFYYIMSPERAYTFSTIMHCVLGGVFMYGFMRSLPVSISASFFSAVVFSFNGFLMGHLYAGHLTFVQNYVWIPFIFYLVLKFSREKRLVHAVCGGFLLGVQILGGFPQIAFYTILSSCLYLLFSSTRFLRRVAYKDVSIVVLGIMIFLFLGFCVAAIQIFPTLQFTALSTRAGGVSYEMATYDSLNPKEVLAFIIPDIFGNAVDGTYWRSPETWHFWETCGYVGILPLLLALVKTKDEELRRIRFFFGTLAGLCLFLALGKYNPLYHFVYRLPGFHSFRIPAQIIFLYVFGIAVLAGMGMNQLRDDSWRFNRGSGLLFIGSGALLCLLMVGVHFFPFRFFLMFFKNFSEGPVIHANLALLYQRVSGSVDKSAFLFFASLLLLLASKNKPALKPFLNILAPLVIVTDLFVFGSQFVETVKIRTPPVKEKAIAELPKDPVQGRVITTGDSFGPNDGLRHGFPSILGYDPLMMRRYAYYIFSSQDYAPNDHVVNLGSIRQPGSKLMKLLHVKKIVVRGAVEDLDNDLPYANIVGRASLKRPEEILPFMKSDQFDPKKMVILEQIAERKNPLKPATEPLVWDCSVLDYRCDRISLKASLNRAGYLVLSEINYPGWYATVDGKKTEILCGNYMFRVIPLEGGTHEIRLTFISWPFRFGALVSLLAIIVSVGVVMGRRGKAGNAGVGQER